MTAINSLTEGTAGQASSGTQVSGVRSVPVRRKAFFAGRRGQFAYQLLMLLGALAVLGTAAWLHLDAHGGVETPGGRHLPTLCVWRNVLSLDCPGCGLTRAFVALAHGQWSTAWRLNAAAPLIFALVLYQVPFRLVQLLRLRRGRLHYAHSPLLIGFLAWGVVAALVVQWAWRIT